MSLVMYTAVLPPVLKEAMIRPSQTASGGGVNVAGNVVAGDVITGYTPELHEAILQRRLAELRADLERAHSAELALKQRELDEVVGQLADLRRSYEAKAKDLGDAALALQRLSDQLPQDRINAAFVALGRGETGEADKLFAEVEAMDAAAINRAATSAYERGKLADADIRWLDAANHYATAARLMPTYDHLGAAIRASDRAGDYAAARRQAEELIKSARGTFGEESQELAIALSLSANSNYKLGNYKSAEGQFRAALDMASRVFGQYHIEYGTVANNFGLLLESIGKYSEAMYLFEQALVIREATQGRLHPEYATNLNNLANLLSTMENLEEAEPLYREALEIRRTTQGKKHPYYANSLNNLAELLRVTNRPEEAGKLHRVALALREVVLGKDHPDYAESLNNVALVLFYEDPVAAEAKLRQAIEIYSRVKGVNHPDTADCIINLGKLLEYQGCFKEAEKCYMNGLAAYEAAFGRCHLKVATSLESLAIVFSKTARAGTAKAHCREAISISARLFGPEHPHTVRLTRTLTGIGRTPIAGKGPPLHSKA